MSGGPYIFSLKEEEEVGGFGKGGDKGFWVKKLVVKMGGGGLGYY